MRVTPKYRQFIALPLAASALCALSLTGCAPQSKQFTMPRWGRGEIDGPSERAMVGAPSRATSDNSMSDIMQAPIEAGRKAGESMRTAWDRASDSFTQAVSFESHRDTHDDPTNLNTPVGQLDADLYIQGARLDEQNGNLAGATQKYERALEIEPNNRKALIGFARLNDRQGDVPQAIALYQQAIKAYPRDAVAYNDLGLCYTLHGRTSEGLTLLGKAVELDPQNARYRNNIAIVLVDLQRYDEALTQLAAVHAPAQAHHNLACLLQAKGQQDMATRHFAQAQQYSASAARQQTPPAQQAQSQYPTLGSASGQPQASMPAAGAVQGVSVQMGPAQPVQVSPSSDWQGYTSPSSPAATSPAATSVRTAELNHQSAVAQPSHIQQVEFAYDSRPLAESSPGDSDLDGSGFGAARPMTAPPQLLPPVE